MLFINQSLCIGKASAGSGGGGSSDSHFKGWFATPSALEVAIPQGTDGDYAIVGTTDTVWVWDSDTSAWMDSGAKSQVESVNGKTGVVNLKASNIPIDTIAGLASTEVQGALGEINSDLNAKQDKSNLVTTISSTSTDTQYPSAKAVYTYSQASITSTSEITITPTASQTATAISGALAKKARVVVIPNINNIGAVYIKESTEYSSINPIYPDPTNNVYEFSNMQNVKVFVDSIGDSVDLVIEYRG